MTDDQFTEFRGATVQLMLGSLRHWHGANAAEFTTFLVGALDVARGAVVEGNAEDLEAVKDAEELVARYQLMALEAEGRKLT